MIGIILVNTGSPSSAEPDDIERYLCQYLMDDRIRQMPKPLWSWLLRKHILPRRKHSSSKRYRFVWTENGSPLVANQQLLAEKVQRLFAETAAAAGDPECGVIVRSAMSYGSPSLRSALSEMRGAGVGKVILLPLYPQSAFSPTLAVVDAFHRALDALDWHPETDIIDNYHDDPGYIAAMANSIRKAGYDPAKGDRLLFSFHAIPLKDERAGDTYRVQIAESVRLIAKELGIEAEAVTVSFQSVFGPHASSWTGPLAKDILEGWRDGDFRVVYACPGFSIDCLETLYDIPYTMVPALEGQSAAPVAEHNDGDIQAVCNTNGRFIWVPTLNTTDVHAELVEGIIVKHL